MNESIDDGKPEIIYASFWSRVAARLLDGVVLYFIFGLVSSGEPSHVKHLFLELLVFLTYETLLLSSKWQGTLGKFLVGLKVSTEDGKRLNFRHALWRSVCALVSYSLLLPLLLVLFTEKKQTLHDKLAKTVVTDSIKEHAAVSIAARKRSTATGIAKFGVNAIFILGVASFLFYAIPFYTVYYMLYLGEEKEYDKSFRVTYKTNDFNDSKIRFYDKELEKNVGKFIGADDLYTRFEYDTKSELAEACIDYHIAVHHGDRFAIGGRNYYKNARNKYADTEKLIEKAKKNEDLVGLHSYTYDFDTVHDSIKEIVSYPGSGKASPCQATVHADKLYETFLVVYMRKYYEDIIRGHYKPLQEEVDWYQALKSRWPHVLQEIENVKQTERELALQRKREREEAVKEKRAELKKNAKRHLYELATSKTSNVPLLQELKNAGADLDMRLQDGQTAMILAAKNENMDLVKRLLDMDVDIAVKDRFGKSVLEYIDRDKYRDVYISLKIKKAMDAVPFEGERTGVAASYNEKTDKVTVTQYGINRKTWSPLILAIEKKDPKAVKQYIDKRLYLEKKTSNGSTAIFSAIIFKNDQALEWLLEAGANLEAKNNSGLTPLYIAVLKKNHYAAKRLLESGADMYAMDSRNIYNPFTEAVVSRDIQMVKLFVDNGVNVNHQYRKSETALTFAGKGCRHIEIFKLLVDTGADPDIEDRYGFTTRINLRRYCAKDSDYDAFYALLD
jgi:ankyrin repeat protein/uncharacterized RDD family membrane protein YckC